MKLFDLFKKARPTKVPKATFSCARCKKELTEDQCHWIGSHRFCESCAASPKASLVTRPKTSPMSEKERGSRYQVNTDYAKGSDTPKEAFRKQDFVPAPDGQRILPHGHSIAHTAESPTIYFCARCKKELTEDQCHWIGPHRFCESCAASPKAPPVTRPKPPVTRPKTSPMSEKERRLRYQVYMDYAKGSDTPEEAFRKRGFIQTPEGQWVLPDRRSIAHTADRPTIYFCARCKKELTEDQCHWIGSHRFCENCAAPPNLSTIASHFSQNAGNAAHQSPMDHPQDPRLVNSDEGPKADASPHTGAPAILSSNKKNAIDRLRNNIIKSLTTSPAMTYELASLLWADAARCFPTSYSFQWDGAWFKIDLCTRQLYAAVGTYPNQFGASRDGRYILSPEEFYQKAVEFDMDEELQEMVTAADWDALFDDTLITAIERAREQIAEQKALQAEKYRTAYGVVIPDSYFGLTPRMDLSYLSLDLYQRFGHSFVSLTRSEDRYLLNGRKLSAAEAVWVEKQVDTCLHDPDFSGWRSHLGGDRMTVRIDQSSRPCVDLSYAAPLKKYIELKDALTKLAHYGSLSETEAKRHRE